MPKKIKIYINYKIKNTPWGGANQFLKAISNYMQEHGFLVENINEADIILLNGNPGSPKTNLQLIYELHKVSPQIPIVIRMDGPCFYRPLAMEEHQWLFSLCRYYANGVIFQSEWSRKNNFVLGMPKCPNETLIANAPDPQIFFPSKVKKKSSSKVRCIATSWSDNIMKGFKDYDYIDKNLDFNKFEFTFVGNTPFIFKNIKHIPPVTSQELGNLLRQHDIFITASENDPCSNSLLEAMYCGLKIIYKNSGGHPELAKNYGQSYDTQQELIERIVDISNKQHPVKNISELPSIAEIAEKYISFLQDVIHNTETPTRPNLRELSHLILLIVIRFLKSKINLLRGK